MAKGNKTIHNVGKSNIVTEEGTVVAGSAFLASPKLVEKLLRMYPTQIVDAIKEVSSDVKKQIEEKQAVINKKDDELAKANKSIEELKAQLEAKAEKEEADAKAKADAEVKGKK